MRKSISSEVISARLEAAGWRRDVAGDEDFTAAVEAAGRMLGAPDRGIIVSGGVGAGKTALVDAIYAMTRDPKQRVPCGDDAAVDWLVPESDGPMNGGAYSSAAAGLMERNVYLDDIGAEIIRMNYGTVYDRVGRFITRYHARGQGRLYITTNLDARQLESRYGARVLDRILDRCVVLKLNGKSKRKSEIVR